jgi:delta24(24(1))-sterol reductase
MSELKYVEKYSLGKKKSDHEEYEFGGPLGVIAIMIFSHTLILYVWLGFEFYDGSLPIAPLSELLGHIRDSAWPTWYIYLSLISLLISILGLLSNSILAISSSKSLLPQLCQGFAFLDFQEATDQVRSQPFDSPF